MTAIVGIRCSDGVVIGADSSATLGVGDFKTVEQATDKIYLVGGRVIFAGTGQVGFAQRFKAILDQEWERGGFSKGTALEVSKQLTREMLKDLESTLVKRDKYGSVGLGAIVAFPFKRSHHLYEFDLMTFQPEEKTTSLWYCSMGSGQQIIDPFLGLMREAFWREGPPSVSDGVFVAYWALDHAIKVNPGGVNGPPQIATLRKRPGEKDLLAKMLTQEELAEHEQNVKAAIAHLGEFKSHHADKDATAPPEAPPAAP